MKAILLKLQPNQDVTEALEGQARAAGMAQARIVAAVGSLVEGVIRRGDALELIEGPAIEVAGLAGDVLPDGGSRLHAYLCREDATVVEGELLRGSNAVGVTFEVLLQEIAAR
jgi:predicted DNA-binding protein with PD1-like motif